MTNITDYFDQRERADALYAAIRSALDGIEAIEEVASDLSDEKVSDRLYWLASDQRDSMRLLAELLREDLRLASHALGAFD